MDIAVSLMKEIKDKKIKVPWWFKWLVSSQERSLLGSASARAQTEKAVLIESHNLVIRYCSTMSFASSHDVPSRIGSLA